MSFEVFILTWNRLPLLKEALGSVLRQTMQPLRVTVMDNASDDGTSEYVQSISSRYGNVRLIRSQEHMTVDGNMRAAVDAADADYFMIMHDDDILSPSFVEMVCAAVDREPSLTMLSVAQRKFTDAPHVVDAVAEIDMEVYGSGVDFAAADFMRFLSDQENSMCFPAMVYRRECVAGCHLDTRRYGKICDKPFVYESMGGGRIGRIVTPLYNYRIHAAQDSSTSANGPFPHEILNLLEAQKSLFEKDAGCMRLFMTLSVLWMKSLYFWGRNPKSEWRKFFRMAKDRGLVRGFLSKPWKHWLWRALTNRKVSGFQKSRMPAVEHIALKGEEP